MNKDFQDKNKDELDRPVSLGLLLEYTDDFLIPRVSDIVREETSRLEQKIKEETSRLEQKIKEETSRLEYNLKSYMDDKLADYTSDIFKRLEKREIKDREFKVRVVKLLKKHSIGTNEDISFLEGLVSS